VASNFYELMSSPEVRRAQQIAYSVQVVSDLAANYDDTLDRGEFAFARAMLDSFYVHVRLLADFLVKRTHDLDFGPRDFGVDWAPSETPAAVRMIEYWAVASKYVVHFGRPRVPENLEDLQAFRVSGEHFRLMATDALEVFDQFVGEVESSALDWHDGSLIPDPVAAPERWASRLRAEQATLLRSAAGDPPLVV
jgi:hypothetical protein